MADIPLPNIPYRSALVDEQGLITPAWSAFLRELYTRVGGPNALTNLELESLSGGAVLQSEVDALELTVAANQAANEIRFDELGQGPNL